MNGKTIQKRVLAIIAICLILVLILAACGDITGSSQSATSTPYPTSIVPLKPEYEVQRGDIVEEQDFRARVVPQLEEELMFKTSGYIHQVYFLKDEYVQAGQVIAELEGLENYLRQLKLQDLQVRRAEIYLENAELALAQFKITRNPYAITYEQELKQQENDVSLAQIGLDEARLHLEDLEEVINMSQVVAPFDGKILSSKLREGRQVSAFDPLVVMGDVDTMELRADLTSDEVKDLEVGMVVEIKSAKRPNEVLSGKIRQIPYLSTGSTDEDDNDNSTRITLDLAESDLVLEIGDLVIITVVLDRSEDALYLPLPAIRNFGGRTFVVLQDGDEQRSVDVALGLEGDGVIEILEHEEQENLVEGQVIVGP